MRPERPRIHLTICGQERRVQLHEFATRHAFRPKEMRVPECGAVPQMFKAQQEAPSRKRPIPQTAIRSFSTASVICVSVHGGTSVRWISLLGTSRTSSLLSARASSASCCASSGATLRPIKMRGGPALFINHSVPSHNRSVICRFQHRFGTATAYGQRSYKPTRAASAMRCLRASRSTSRQDGPL
jgi:hypothetical protein